MVPVQDPVLGESLPRDEGGPGQVSEMGVVPGACAGLLSLPHAAAQQGGLTWDVVQGVRSDQVPGSGNPLHTTQRHAHIHPLVYHHADP